ncbi:MAG TPA: phosphatase PAP2 family protein [Solirubrobacterales bacterium]|nr:phosphatase PAP2 family protein [Solirubrobacterales bacterium]
MPGRATAPFAASLACAAAFLVLAIAVHRVDDVQHLDAALLLRFLEPGARGGSVAAVVVLLGDLAVLLPLLAVACGIALLRGLPRQALAAFAVVAGANLSTQLFKVALAHPRVQSMLGMEQIAANSFPSGHTTAIASAAVAFLFVVPREWRGTVAFCGALAVAAVGCSVMALSWHFPSDVLGGLLVVAAWGFGVLAALRTAEALPGRGAQASRRPAISVK